MSFFCRVGQDPLHTILVAVRRQVQILVHPLFTKNNNHWVANTSTPNEARWFRETLKKLGVSHPIAHDSQLINLASRTTTRNEELGTKN